MVSDKAKFIINHGVLASILVFIGILVSQTVGLGRTGFDSSQVLTQFFFYAGPAIGFLVGILILAFVELQINKGDGKYGNSVSFASHGKNPAFDVSVFNNPWKLLILSLILFSVLGIFTVTQNVTFTGVGTLKQQFTTLDSIIFTGALVPMSENLGSAFLWAFAIFGIRYYARKYNWTSQSFRYACLFAAPILFGVFGLFNHLLRYGSADIELFRVFIFWALGGFMTVATGSFIPFWIMHTSNNTFFDFAKHFSSTIVVVYVIIFILALGFIYYRTFMGQKTMRTNRAFIFPVFAAFLLIFSIFGTGTVYAAETKVIIDKDKLSSEDIAKSKNVSDLIDDTDADLYLLPKKIYDDSVKTAGYGKITFENFNGLGGKMAEISLNSNVCDSPVSCITTGTTTLHQKTQLFTGIEANDRTGDLTNLTKPKYYVYITKNVSETRDTFATTCNTINAINGTSYQSCSNSKNGTITTYKVQSVKVPYNYEVLPAGTYNWSVEGTRPANYISDVIPESFGIKLNEYFWWDEAWGRKKEINISEWSGYSLTNYSVLMNVTYDSDMQVDFDDIRFLDSTESIELPYWIENHTNSGSAMVWVKTNVTANKNTTIFMYYNNTAATNKSNYTQAFIYKTFFSFDDGWKFTSDGAITAGMLDWSGSDLWQTKDIGNHSRLGLLVEYSGQNTEAGGESGFWGKSLAGAVTTDVGILYYTNHNDRKEIQTDYGSGAQQYANVFTTTEAWHKYKFVILPNRTIQSYVDDSYKGTDQTLTSGYDTALNISFGSGWGGQQTYIDNVTIRAFTAIEPNATFYSEQTNVLPDTTAPNVSIIYPANTTYTQVVNHINLTFSDADSCWYSTNNWATNTSFVCANNATGLTASQGNNIWHVGVNDTSNNINMTNVTFFVDSIKPLISYGIFTETNNTNISRGNLVLNASATDSNFVNMTHRIYNSAHVLVGSSVSTALSNLTNFTGLSDGLYYFNTTALDILANSNSTETRQVRIDTANPQISYGTRTETNNTVITRSNIFINATVSDDTFANMTFNLYNSSHSNVKNQTNFTTTAFANFTGLSDGLYYFNVSTVDLLLHTNQTTTYNITIDTTAPNATVVSPSGTVTSQQQTIDVDADAGFDACTINITRGQIVEFGNVLLPSCNTADFFLPQDGEYTVHLAINDSYNNVRYVNKTFTLQMIITPSTETSGGGSSTVTSVSTQSVNGTAFTLETDKGGSQYEINVVQGSIEYREIIIKNNENKVRNVKFSCVGEMCDYIKLSNQTIKLKGINSSEEIISFTLEAPQNFELKEYKTTLYGTDEFGNQESIEITANFGGIFARSIEAASKLGKLKTLDNGFKYPYFFAFFATFAGMFALLNFMILRKYQYKEITSVVIGIVVGYALLFWI